jgi:anionic cell wall polymer biosynthesis LytR-Cps2A-Psr (LCP) family protein
LEDLKLKQFFKVFFISLVCFSLIITGGLFWLNGNLTEGTTDAADIFKILSNDKDSRINVLLLGLENTRSDTIMLVTYDTKNKTGDLISIPRDTYVDRDGFVNSGNNKINSVYTVKGIEGLSEIIYNITGIKPDKYVTIDYDGVRAAFFIILIISSFIPKPLVEITWASTALLTAETSAFPSTTIISLIDGRSMSSFS